MLSQKKFLTLVLLSLTALVLNQNCGQAFRATTDSNSLDGGSSPGTPLALSDIAPDPTLKGPFPVIEGEYRLPAAIDTTVVSDLPTELWAKTFAPQSADARQKLPLLVFLHGNHATCGRRQGNIRIDDTCEYTMTGTCPTGSAVVPNHEGYNYLGEHFASHGYLVVSINANRGITCRNGGSASDLGFIQARGRLTLRHLQQLADWHRNGQTPLSNNFEFQSRIDFSRVGLMGHSRGGEGVRAALELYRSSNSPWRTSIQEPVAFLGVFEIAPVDGMAGTELNGAGVPWAVLLPHCDGDVADLSGQRPFDRVVARYSTTEGTQTPLRFAGAVWGANHNFFNTEWQQSESPGCFGHTPLWSPGASESEAQRASAVATMSSFFRGAEELTKAPRMILNLDPAFRLSSNLTNQFRLDRELFHSPTNRPFRVLENFSGNFPLGSFGFAHTARNANFSFGSFPPHDDDRKMARVNWQPGTENGSLTLNLSNDQVGIDLGDSTSLDVSLARGLPIGEKHEIFARLISTNGRSSDPIEISSYADLHTPIGIPSNPKAVLQTVRIPVHEIRGLQGFRLRAVEFSFPRNREGSLLVSALRLSKAHVPTFRSPSGSTPPVIASAPSALGRPQPRQGTIRALIDHQPSAGSQANNTSIDIEVSSPDGFPVMDSLPTLVLQNQKFYDSRYPSSGATDKLIFRVPKQFVDSLQGPSPSELHYGSGAGALQYDLGTFAGP